MAVIRGNDSGHKKRTPAVARRGEKGERRRKGIQLSGTAAAPDQLSADIFYITTAFWVYL
jgi:hypothetical protein